jgi:hypothetical protein
MSNGCKLIHCPYRSKCTDDTTICRFNDPNDDTDKDEIDTYQTDTPVCPHCGATYTDLVGFLDETSGDDQCIECGKWYSWESEYTVEFYTRKIDWLKKWKNYNRDQIRKAQLRLRGIYKEI